MSGYILCETKKAEIPYFIENISTNIYTIEELCYYLYHNLYLIDETIINEGLCSWIQEELDLPKLAAKLRPNLGKYASAEDILYPIFKEINYLTYEELRVLNGRMKKYEEEPLPVREKQKGDALVENKMYVTAIHVYQTLLERDDLEISRAGITESILHNLGCAYSYLFQMEKAVEYFFKAYEQNHSRKALVTYFLAFRIIRTPIEYENRITELHVDEETRKEIGEALEHFDNLPEPQMDSQHIDSLLEKMIREYHRSTGS